MSLTTPEALDDGRSAIKNRLSSIDPEAASQMLDAHAASGDVDSAAGIYILPLGDVEPVDYQGQRYRFYLARVMSGKLVNPHVHSIGDEPYHFLSGGGKMNLGAISEDRVEWKPPVEVGPGDTIIVGEGQVHSFVNNGGVVPSDFAFACPDAHLTDRTPDNPEGDRIFTADLVSGMPPSTN